MIIVPARDSGEVDTDIIRYYQEGYTRQEIGVELDLGTGTISRRLSRLFRWGILHPRGGRWRRKK